MVRTARLWIVVLTALLVLSPLGAMAQVPNDERLKELLAQQIVLRAQIEAMTGSGTLAHAIIRSRGDIYEYRRQIDVFEGVAQDFETTNAELMALQEEARALPDKPSGAQKALSSGVRQLARLALGQAARRLLGAAGKFADLAEEAALVHIRNETQDSIRDLINTNRINQQDVTQYVIALYKSIGAERRHLDELIRLQKQERALFAEIAGERETLSDFSATDQAELGRETDAEGDVAEAAIAAAEPARTVMIDWYTDDSGLVARNTYICPPTEHRGYFTANVVGTLLYKHKSRVCEAALHAGVISRAGGAVQLIFVRPMPEQTFEGSERNGVISGSSHISVRGGFIVRPAG